MVELNCGVDDLSLGQLTMFVARSNALVCLARRLNCGVISPQYENECLTRSNVPNVIQNGDSEYCLGACTNHGPQRKGSEEKPVENRTCYPTKEQLAEDRYGRCRANGGVVQDTPSIPSRCLGANE